MSASIASSESGIEGLSTYVTLAQQGDVKAYEQLIRSCQNLVTSIALAIVKDVDDSQEVAQQVFVSAWQNLHKLKASTSFLPWIRQSTRYTAYNFLRDNKVSSRLSTEQADDLLAQVADPRLHYDEQLVVDNQNAILQSFIDELAEDDREIVLLYYREEQSSKQVAELLNLSESNVRKKLSRVRQTLKADILQRAGHLAYSTAPTLAFSTLISSLIVPSAPAAAVTLAAGSASSKSSSGLLVKLATLVGGAFIGAFLAIIAIFWSSNTAMKTLTTAQHKKILTRYRNQLIALVLFFAVSFTLSIQFTQGWLAPVASYTVFMIGFLILMVGQMRFLNASAAQVSRSPKQRVIGYVCLVLSVVISLTATLAGLVNSGRIAF